MNKKAVLISSAFLLPIFLGAKVFALHTSPGSIEPGDRGTITIPFENMAGGISPIVNVRITTTTVPSWIKISSDSFMGPATIYPGISMAFSLDFEIGQNYEAANSSGEIALNLLSDSTSFVPTSLAWRFVTTNGFLTMRGKCVDNEGIACGDYVSPDIFPSQSSLSFDPPEFIDAQNRVFISTVASVYFDSFDQYDANSIVSRVASTGHKIDSPATAFEELNISSEPISLAEGLHTLYYASRDNAGNTEAVKFTSVTVDGTAPEAPILAKTDVDSPSPWRAVKEFNLSWTNPVDVSGISGARVKFGGPAPVSSSEGVFYPADTTLVYSSTEIISGQNMVWVWLEDNVGNADPAKAVPLILRYDDTLPISAANAPAVSSSPVVMIGFISSDSLSGVDKTVLWFRNSAVEWSSGAYVLANSSGVFSFNASAAEGTWEFYTQAYDNAGNAEAVPVSTTQAKAASYVDLTPPVISNVRVTEISYDSARITWETDDAAYGLLEYGLSGAADSKITAPGYYNTRSLLVSGLVYPADYSFRITAVNKTGMSAVYSGGTFYVPPKMTTNIDALGVLNTNQPIIIEVTNPNISSITYTLNGQTVTQAVSPSMPLQIYVPSGQGQTSLSLNLDGFVYSTNFVVDTSTRTIFLARFSAVDGGIDSAQGGYASLAAVGQPLQAEASNINGKVYFGYYAGIDPAAPGRIGDLSAVSGPAKDQVGLSWTAPGDDAYAGTAVKYDVRWSTAPISRDNFAGAAKGADIPFPQAAGTAQVAVFSGLNQLATYYFSIRTEDELGNISELSNMAAVFKGYALASTVTINGISEISFMSPLEPSINLVSTVSAAGAVAIGSAAAGGLTLAGSLYEIGPEGTFDPPAVLTFYYSTGALAGLGLLESDMAVYEHFPVEGWVKLPGQVLDSLAHKVTVPITRIASLFSIFGIVKDRAAPFTDISLSGARYETGGKVYMGAGSSVTLTSYDPVVYGTSTGVAFTEYRVDPGTSPLFSLYTEPFTLGEGFRVIGFHSQDKAGNQEPVKYSGVYVDTSAPLTSALIEGATGQAGWYISIATVTLVSTDNLSGLADIYFRAGTSTEAVKYTGPVVISAEGLSPVNYYARDNVGNFEGEKNIQLRLDMRAPEITVISSPPANSAGWNNTLVAVIFSGTDTVSGVGYCESSKTIAMEGASQKVSGYCADNAGNYAVGSLALNIDMTPPAVIISSPAAGQVFVATKDKVEIAFTVKDNLDPAPRVTAVLTQVEDRGSPRGVRPSSITVVSGQSIEPLEMDDGLWRLAVNAVDLADNQDSAGGGTFEVIHDVLPPRTALDAGADKYQAGLELYVTGKTTFTVASIDDLVAAGDALGFGVKTQDVIIAGGVERGLLFANPAPSQGKSFTSEFRLDLEADGIYSLTCNSEDVLGNSEKVYISTVIVDNTAPLTQANVQGVEYRTSGGDMFVSSNSGIMLGAIDVSSNSVASGLKTTSYRLDSAGWLIYVSTINVSTLAEGAHVINYYSLDNLDNAEAFKTLSFMADFSFPVSVLNLSGEQYKDTKQYIGSRTNIVITAVDPAGAGPASGVKETRYSVDGGVFGNYSVFKIDSEGKHTVSFYSADYVNNTEAVKAEELWVDTTLPVTVLAVSGSRYIVPGEEKIYITGNSGIMLTAVDPLSNNTASGVLLTKYRLDGGNWQMYVDSFSITSEGLHTVEYYTVDRVQNTETGRIAKLAVDNTPPVSAINLGEPKAEVLGLPVLTPDARITLSAADPVVNEAVSGLNSIFYEIENVQTGERKPAAAYTLPFAIPEHGTFVIRYWAKDNTGNIEEGKEIMVAVATWREDGLIAVSGLDMAGTADIAGRVESNGPISLAGNARILGDVTASTITLAGKAQITGLQVSEAAPLNPAPISLSGIVQRVTDANNNTLVAPYLVDGKLVLDSKAAIVLSTGAYYFKGMELGGGSSVTVTGKVDIVVDGGISINGGSSLNAMGTASLLSIIVSTTSELKFNGGAALAGCVYAPYSSLVLSGNALLGGHYFVGSGLVSGTGNILQSGDSLPAVPPASGGIKTRASARAAESAGILAGPDPSFRLGEVYVYPNPAKGADAPTFHVECGMADSVKITIYTISGREAHEQTLVGMPAMLDDGNGLAYAYEYTWRGHIPSGVYLYYIEAQRSGQKLKKTGKFAVVR